MNKPMLSMPLDKLARARRMLDAIEPLVFARRSLTMGLLLAITLLLGWQALLIGQGGGFEKSLPLDHPYTQVYRQYQADFGSANTVQVALIHKQFNIYNAGFLGRLQVLNAAMGTLPNVDRTRLHSLFTPDLRFVDVVEGRYFSASVIPAEFSAAKATPEMLQKIRGNVGKAGIVGRYVSNDQRGALIEAELLEVDPASGERIDYRELSALLEDQVRGRITSPKAYDYQTRAAVGPYPAGALIHRSYTDLGGSLSHTKILADQRNADGSRLYVSGADLDVSVLPNPDYSPNYDVRITGTAKLLGDVAGQTRPLALFFAIAMAIALVLLWLGLGSLRLAFLPLACALVALVWTAGLLNLLGFGFDPFAIALPLLILALAISHGVQQVSGWSDEITSRNCTPFEAALTVWRRLAAIAITAILGVVAVFGTLLLVPVDSVRELALGTGIGLVAVLISTQLMLPIWLTWVRIGDVPRFAAKQERRAAIFDRLWRLLAKMTEIKPAIGALVVCAALLGWAQWQGKQPAAGGDHAGAPELSAKTRYNLDQRVIAGNFALSTDVLKIIAETQPDSCAQSSVLEQIDTLAWRLENAAGVRATLSLPAVSKVVYTAFSEGSPKFKALARNRDTLIQAIAPITPATGLLNANCSAMPIWVFTADRKSATMQRIVGIVDAYNQENAADFFDSHRGVDSRDCTDRTTALRELGAQEEKFRRRSAALKQAGMADADVAADVEVAALRVEADQTRTSLETLGTNCPVHFALAAGSLGAAAAADDVTAHFDASALIYVYIALVAVLVLTIFEWPAVAVILLPLGLVSLLSQAAMSVLGVSLNLRTLPWVLLSAGIGLDYGIYLYSTLSEALAPGVTFSEACYRALKNSGRALLASALALAAGIAVWLFAELQFQRDLGELMMFVVIANTLAMTLVLPAIARFLIRERKPILANTRMR